MQKNKKRKQGTEDENLIVEENNSETLSSSIFGVRKDEIKDWFRGVRTGIKTSKDQKVNIPKGVWTNCKKCNQIFSKDEVIDNLFVCPACSHHHRIPSMEYMNILFDNGRYKTLFDNISPVDILKFSDLEPYTKRLESAQATTKLKDAMRVGYGRIGGHDAVIAAMDFNFIGGSLGCVVGEKFCLAVEFALKKKTPFICIPQSGGARMMESAYSLMQMPKTLASLYLFAEKKLPYIVILTDPTYGGVTASFAMMGDIHLAEPKARIGFAGPRIIEELIKKPLPENFQTSESLKENGFVDRIVHRKDLKNELSQLLFFFKN